MNVRREGTSLRYTANTEALQRTVAIPLSRMLHSKQSAETARHRSDLQIGEEISSRDIKRVVKEKYGQAALRVNTGGSEGAVMRRHRIDGDAIKSL